MTVPNINNDKTLHTLYMIRYCFLCKLLITTNTTDVGYFYNFFQRAKKTFDSED